MLANKGGSLLFFENSRRLFMQVLAAKKPTEIVVRVFLESDEAARTEIFPIFDSVAPASPLLLYARPAIYQPPMFLDGQTSDQEHHTIVIEEAPTRDKTPRLG